MRPKIPRHKCCEHVSVFHINCVSTGPSVARTRDRVPEGPFWGGSCSSLPGGVCRALLPFSRTLSCLGENAIMSVIYLKIFQSPNRMKQIKQNVSLVCRTGVWPFVITCPCFSVGHLC